MPGSGGKLRCVVTRDPSGFFTPRYVIDAAGSKVYWRMQGLFTEPGSWAVVVWQGRPISTQLEYLDAPGYDRTRDTRPGYPNTLPAYANRLVAFNEFPGRHDMPRPVELTEAETRAARLFAIEALLVLNQSRQESPRMPNYRRFPLYAAIEDDRVLTLADFGYTPDARLAVLREEPADD